jgi:STE24 endopeptidase|tara:strand:- start:305 stop:1549 length:1245 start_codon:yes stop_codon:yes gene_type:complete
VNFFTYIFLFSLFAGIFVQWFLVQKHISCVRSNRNNVPEAFNDKISLEAHQKAADYTEAKVKTGLFELIIGSTLLLLWTLAGGLQFLDNWLRTFGMSEILTGTALILSVFAIMAILELPLSLFKIFKIEQSFGFNKMTPKIFFVDLLKNTIVGFLIGAPLLLFVLWIMENSGTYWWVYVWFTWLTFSLLMMWVYPAFIAPIFNKFRTLENDELKTRIENLLARNGFKSNGIFVMDGSTRSTHGNAYFTGLGANKRIVFFDTLINELSFDEIEAVLAHELGHFKCNHIRKRILLLATIFFIGLVVLGWLINQAWFYNGLGIDQMSTYIALLLFVMISPAFTFFMQPLFSFISRQHEFEADDFAAGQAQTENLITALVNLYRENANTLTPDPLYSAFHDSHPPAPIRIAHLKNKFS